MSDLTKPSEIFYNSNAAIEKSKPFTLRKYLRKVALDSLSMTYYLGRFSTYLNKPRVQFIYLHHVFKDEEYRFVRLLKDLSVNHQIISYSEAVDSILQAKIEKPCISISFDDGFKNSVRAAEIMQDFGIKSCFFIDPAITDFPSYAQRKIYCQEHLHSPPIDFMNWKDIELVQKLGHEIGSHGFEHQNMALQSEEVMREKLALSFDMLAKYCGKVKHFTFPYGKFKYFSSACTKAVFETGFYSCASAVRGCHINPEQPLNNDKLCILRDHLFLDGYIDHVLYFLAKNSKQADTKNNFFPTQLSV